MIKKFRMDTCLLMIDVQDGVDDLQYWGGENGRRNNPDAETNIKTLLTAWRAAGLPVFYTAHDSREAHSPLKLTESGGAFKTGLEPCDGEPVFKKDVNSGFIGTDYDAELIHDTSIANLNGEFCTAIRTGAALALLENNNERLERVQGNE